MSTYNRSHLLARSLVCYQKQDFSNDRFELVIVDDSSTDHTNEMVRDWSHATGIRCTYLTPHPKPDGWRDCAASINHGIRVSQGKHILLTHPEIMVGRSTVKDCVNRLEEFENIRYTTGLRDPIEQPNIGIYVSTRTYYLSPKEQTLLDTVNWIDKGPLAVRDIERFYEDDINGHPDFCHRATDIVAQPGSRMPTWESWIFSGHSRETWKRLGGLQRTVAWGSVDVGRMARRRTLGINTFTPPNESALVCHQNHDSLSDIPTPRIESLWKEELGKFNFNNPRELVYPYIDELGWL